MSRYTIQKSTMFAALLALTSLFSGAYVSAQNATKPMTQSGLTSNKGSARTYLSFDDYLTVGDYVVNETNTAFSQLDSMGRFCSYRGTPELPGQLLGCSTKADSGAGPYFLVYQSDANLCVYRGTQPSDNRGRIWCAGPRGDAKPNYLTVDNSSGLMAVRAGAAPLTAGKLYSTMERAPTGYSSIYRDVYTAGSTEVFTQKFKSQITSYPTELTLMLRSSTRLNNIHLMISVNGVAAFDRMYDEMVEVSGGGYVFPLRKFPGKVNRGDWVSFSVATSEATSVQGVPRGDVNAPPGRAGVSDVTARFSMTGATAPDPRSYEDPAMLGSNLSGTFYYLNKLAPGKQLVMNFIAAQTGTPGELGVSWCPAGQAAALRFAIEVNGKPTFSKTYQVPSLAPNVNPGGDGCWTVLPLDGYAGTITTGDGVKFVLTSPDAARNTPDFTYFSNGNTPRPGMSGVLNGGPGSLLKFYMKLK